MAELLASAATLLPPASFSEQVLGLQTSFYQRPSAIAGPRKGRDGAHLPEFNPSTSTQ